MGKKDPSESIEIRENMITWSETDRNTGYAVFKKFREGSITDFDHSFEVSIEEMYTNNENNLMIIRFWECRIQDNTKIFLYARQNAASTEKWKMVFAQNKDGKNLWNYISSADFEVGKVYYIKLSRNNVVLNFSIYSNEEKTNLIETIEIILDLYEKYDEIYLCTVGKSTRGSYDSSSGYIANFDVNPDLTSYVKNKDELFEDFETSINGLILNSIEIERFRTVKTLQKLNLDPVITTLVGPNESGKTNILHAIECFNLTNSFKEEDISRSDESYDLKEYPKISFIYKPSNNKIFNQLFNIEVEWNFIKIIKNGNKINDYKFEILGKDGAVPVELNDDDKRSFLEKLPKVYYYKLIDLIPDKIPITEMKLMNTDNAISYNNFLNLGGIDDLSFLNESNRRINIVLRKASKKITEEIKKLWKQEEININIIKVEESLSISIDEDVSVNSTPNERSEGFQWFLAFIMKFVSNSELYSKKNIILFDEPAIRLHPRGQKDFLRTIENISNENQIIYTSHSPFLINRNFPHRIRMLEKNRLNGTEINNKPYSDGKCRFWEPLRSSIGICLGDMLSIGEKNLIVEGISDQMLLSGTSYKMSKNNLPYLDLEKLSIVPAMNADSAVHLGILAVSNELPSVILLDNDLSGNNAKKRAKDSGHELNIIQVNKFNKKAITIEDLFPLDVYLKSVNEFYSKFNWYKALEKPTDYDENEGVLSLINKHFKQFETRLDKVSVASHLVSSLLINTENAEQYKPIIKLFEYVNKV